MYLSTRSINGARNMEKIKKFSGGDDTNPEDWFVTFNNVMNDNGYDEEKKKKILYFYLEGAAYWFYRKICDSCKSFAELQERIVEEFPPFLAPTQILYLKRVPVIATVTLEIDGVIDLGPKWNYAYSVIPKIAQQLMFNTKPSTMTTMSVQTTEAIHIGRERKEEEIHEDVGVTLIEDTTKSKIFRKPHAVKDDKEINEFAFHVYKQSLKVFDVIKKKVDPKIWPKVDFIARSYDDKFRAFVEDTLNQNIKTSLGTQKVVLNTIDTSNRLMTRLVNYFSGELSRDGALRTQMDVANVLQKEVDKETYLEYRHVCTKFKICRTAYGFNNFMVDLFTTLLRGDDQKLKQASDALTEVLKSTDFTKIMTKTTHDKFLIRINDVETWDAVMTRAMFVIMKNIFALKNQPLKVMMHGTEHVQSTVVMIEVIDDFDKALPPNEENVLTWTDTLTSLNQWQNNKRDDLVEIFQSLVLHINEYGVNSMSEELLEKMKQKFALIFN